MSDRTPLTFRADRRYPVTLAMQDAIADAHDVCSHCVSGACCTTEGAIALTPFDVLRLAAFFDLSPGAFLEAFTQDRFVDPAGQERYTTWIEAPSSSIVTFLRRRSLAAGSPCLFLKYVHDADGTPRRICSVHPARPLACREYYYDTCRKRSTGETALVVTDGYEAVRDGELTLARVDAELAALGAATPDDGFGQRWQRAFWIEMRRALRIDDANADGAADPGLAAMQDPVDAKLDRLLSSPNLRFEEKYGPQPHSEQLHTYNAGRTFRDSDDRHRLLHIVATPPVHGLYPVDGDYDYHIGLRGLMPGAALPQRFGAVAQTKRGAVATAIARGWTFLIGLASLSERNEGLMELEPRAELECLLLDALLRFTPAQQRRLGVTLPPLARRWLVRVVALALAAELGDLAQRRASVDDVALLCARARRFDVAQAPRELADVVVAIRAFAATRLSRASGDAELARWQAGRRDVARLERLMAYAWTAPPRRARAFVAAIVAGLDGSAATAARRLALIETLVRGAGPLVGDVTPQLAAIAQSAAAALQGRDAWPLLALRLGLPVPADAASAALAAQAADGSWCADPPLAALPDWQDRHVVAIVQAGATALDILQAVETDHDVSD
jgi:Fe-S-cluster containining protein